jgi:hypothetical protein
MHFRAVETLLFFYAKYIYDLQETEMNDVIIIDDVIDKATQDLIESTALGKETQWTFARSVFYDKHPEVTSIQKKSLMSFTKQLVNLDTAEVDPQFQLYSKILQAVENKLSFRISVVYNARIQLQLPLLTEKDKVWGVPHIDAHRDVKYFSLVYYVNDVDGDTVIFKQRKGEITAQDVIDGKLDVMQKVSPKKGRVVIFDGELYHAVGKPKTDMRCIINFNYR